MNGLRNKKYFLISIDTEGDNLWEWKLGDSVQNENAKFLGKFQTLCEKYGFKPTFLVNYEIMESQSFVDEFKPKVHANKCEIGLHLHAWNSPPLFELENVVNEKAAPYLIEYPVDVMEKKIAYLISELNRKFDIKVRSHRAGRWAMNDQYFRLLAKYGIEYDCSITPHIDWSGNVGATRESKGSDYTKCSEQPYLVNYLEKTSVLEIPVTIRESHSMFKPSELSAKSILRSIYKAVRGQYLWLRPNGINLEEMKWVLDTVYRDKNTDYVMFMLHSSELMAGGSPSFKTQAAIDKLYEDIEQLFMYASEKYYGMTISDYGDRIKRKYKENINNVFQYD